MPCASSDDCTSRRCNAEQPASKWVGSRELYHGSKTVTGIIHYAMGSKETSCAVAKIIFVCDGSASVRCESLVASAV